jgi:mono/diheme cytochrome c family protein
MPQVKAYRSVLFSVCLAASACGNQEAAPAAPAEPAPAAPAAEPAPPAPAPVATAEDAKKYFGERCAVCHGDTGHGDGPGGASLTPKPRDFSDAAWQGATQDDQIEKVILGGGPAIGKSPIMPPQPDLKNNESLLKELVKYLRTLKA